MRRILLLIAALLLIPVIASAQLQSSPDLDYDALIASPDEHKEEIYLIAGDVAVVQAPSQDDSDDKYEMLLVSLDGDATRPVYIAYTPRDDKPPIQVGDNPAAEIHLAGTPKKDFHIVDRQQLPDFFKAAQSTRCPNELQFMILTGLRLGEVRGLRWGDVDLDAGTVNVRQQLRPKNKKMQRFTLPKYKK